MVPTADTDLRNWLILELALQIQGMLFFSHTLNHKLYQTLQG